MKKKVLTLLVAAVFLLPLQASAIDLSIPVEGFETTLVTSTTYGVTGMTSGKLLDGTTLLYGWVMIPTANSAACAIFGVNTQPEIALTQGVLIDELYQATSGNSVSSDWPEPYKLTDGLSVECRNALVILYHEAL